MDLTNLNEFQTPITEELLSKYPHEVVGEFYDYINQVPFIQHLISGDRPRAKDLPRDDKGRIIIDLCKPHINEDMDYFRESAIHFQKHGVYTKMKVDMRNQSPYQKWFRREMWRCWYGMVRPEDGEWVTGPMYYYLNYFPIIQTVVKEGFKTGFRTVDFPQFWEGVYWRFHYWHQARYGGLYNDFQGGEHAAEIASRGKGKSYSGAAFMVRNLLIGTSVHHRTKVKTSVIADIGEYLDKDGILNKFEDGYRFAQEHTQFPSRFLKESWTDYNWISGYKESTGQTKGSKNIVLGVLCNGDSDKVRGKRVDTQIYEEFGSFSKFITTYQTGQPNVAEAGVVFGQSITFGTGGTEGNNFAGALEFINHPKGYKVYGLPNFYDKGSTGKTHTLFYFPAYVNAKGYYNSDGVSDVIGAMLDELMERYTLKYNSSDPRMLSQRKAEYSFTLKEAIMATHGTLYNVAALNERINYLDMNPEVTSDMLMGKMKLDGGEVKFDPTADVRAITMFPHKDNKMHGAVLIDQLPIKDTNGKITSGRYIAGIDTFDDDESSTLSLISCLVMDLFTDQIVAEYTGRLDFADDTYEQVRLLVMFYNAEANYESNKKGLFSYFSRYNSTYLLSDVLEFLKDKDWAKDGRGNKSKGTNANAPVKHYGKRIIRDYLNAPVEIEVPDPDDANETVITTVPRLSTLKFRALLQELAMHNDDGNFDRHDALVMLMLLREDKLRLYNGRPSDYEQVEEDDEFFIKNYDNKIGDKGMRLSENGIMTLNSKQPSYLTSEEAYNQIKNYMR